MGALPRPDVPEGPVRVLFDELHRLHHLAGRPSLRDMAKEVGCSHTTVSAAFSGARVPRWGLLELVVEALGGDTEAFHRLWLHASGAADPVAVASRVAKPRHLPADVPAFTGRADQLAGLDRLLAAADDTPAVVVSVVSGTAGVGKTALAVHWAHRVADRFPDGQLYVDLRGYAPGAPVSAAQALSGFLRALGVDSADVPHDPAERAARYRTLLAGRRVLVLLDNACSVDQVRDLLPGTPGCFVLVTGRDALPGLVARHGAVRIDLDLLPEPESVALLRALIGPRVDAEPAATAALADRCAHLPLALRIAAELAAAQPDVAPADLVAGLDDESARLDLLTEGQDEHTALRAVFSWSRRHLGVEAVRVFGLLGLHPGHDLDVPACAALADVPLPRARSLLGELARAHLVVRSSPGRFSMHDLLRGYAAEQAGEREAALARLHRHYLDAAARTGDRGWLDVEWRTLLAIADDPRRAVEVSAVLDDYLDARAYYAEALVLHERAVARGGGAAALSRLAKVHRRLGDYDRAAEHYRRALCEADDRRDEAVALHGLGTVLWRVGDYEQARERLSGALELYRQVGDAARAGSVLYGLGIACRRLGRYADALDCHRRAVALLRDAGDRVEEARALNNLGVVHLYLGQAAEALACFERSLAAHRELADRTGEGVLLCNVGRACERLGRWTEAFGHYTAALEVFPGITGYRVGRAHALHGYGVLCHRLGRGGEALEHLDQAIAIGRELHETDVEMEVLNDLGDILRELGRDAEARDRHRAALAIAERSGDRYQQARALAGLGDPGRAADVLAELGVPEAERLRLTADVRPAPGQMPTYTGFDQG